jgi:hypothetical protein
MKMMSCIGPLVALMAVVAVGSPCAAALPGDAARDAHRADLEARRAELDGVSPGRVRQEILRRANELGVTVPADVLADLLTGRAETRLALDVCRLEAATPAGCPEPTAELERLEARFRDLVGFSMEEFKSGRLDGESEARGTNGVRVDGQLETGIIFPGGGSTRTDPQYCSCSLSVASKDRWVNRWWGLECNGHAGHGYCSNDLDWAHSAGAGAMTGKIELYFGTQYRSKTCEDDHRTCFRGPIPTSKSGGGHWTNVCNCDTVHSQFSNPSNHFYGGDLADATLVQQGGFVVRADGPCAGQGFALHEFIKENDPVCCDDPMGTLVVFGSVGEGTTIVDLPASATNCNGGSQSGVPPYCGSFGATLRVTATCQTVADDPYGSCYGSNCGQVLPDATCNCDFGCQQYGDCCFDYCDGCLNASGGPPQSCDPGGGVNQ